MSTIDIENSPLPSQLLEQLVRGYDALNAEFKLLNEYRRELENKLSWAKQQYREAIQRFDPDNVSKIFQEFLKELDEAAACEKEGGVSWLDSLVVSQDENKRNRAYEIQRGEDARGKIWFRLNPTEYLGSRTGYSRSSGRNGSNANLERDFTNHGTPGQLKCPFAKLGNAGQVFSVNGHRSAISTPCTSGSRGPAVGRRSKRPSFHDPIKAEVCQSKHPSSAAPSAEGSVPLCPIRFLDQHSPEEVALYFEKHKHELPKSHEFCVKRYQGNEESLRQLDKKFPNLASMIQGLGVKHKPMFPSPDEVAVDDDGEVGASPEAKVQDWAQGVSASLETETEVNRKSVPLVNGEEDRETRFGRSLREVRVGESPTRPWGIQVPENVVAEGEKTASPLEETNVRSNSYAVDKGPLGDIGVGEYSTPPLREGSKAAGSSRSQRAENEEARRIGAGERDAAPQLVFNGPVFFGYSADQAAALLKQTGLGDKP